MASILERFRNRKNRTQVFTVPFPVENPEIEFTVKRMPEAVKNNARIDARGTLRRAGMVKPSTPFYLDDLDEKGEKRVNPEWEEFNSETNGWFAYHLLDQGRDHFTAWKALDSGELPSFSKAAFAEFVAELDIPEKQTLGFSYLIQVGKADREQEEQGKNESAEPTS